MEYILDANTLIYLVKLNFHEEFIKLVDNGKIIIDSSVYDEVVVKGIKNNYPDAHVAKKFLQQHQLSMYMKLINGSVLSTYFQINLNLSMEILILYPIR